MRGNEIRPRTIVRVRRRGYDPHEGNETVLADGSLDAFRRGYDPHEG